MVKGRLWKPAPIELVKGSQDRKLGQGLEVGVRAVESWPRTTGRVRPPLEVDGKGVGLGDPHPLPAVQPVLSQPRWQLASPGHLAPWSDGFGKLWADGFGKRHLPLLHGLRTQPSVTFLSISALWLAGGWALPLPPRRFCGVGGVCLTPNSAWRLNSGVLRLLPPPHK